MADPDSRVHPNNEFRERLTEKVYSAVTETGRLAQQCIKGSRSHEVRCLIIVTSFKAVNRLRTLLSLCLPSKDKKCILKRLVAQFPYSPILHYPCVINVCGTLCRL